MTDGEDRRLVYSSDGGRQLGNDKAASRQSPAARRVPDDGVVRVFRERRRGSSVTVVTGLADSELQSVSADLRRRCATGGTCKNGVVELQGDQREAVIAFFQGLGRRVKRAGG